MSQTLGIGKLGQRAIPIVSHRLGFFSCQHRQLDAQSCSAQRQPKWQSLTPSSPVSSEISKALPHRTLKHLPFETADGTSTNRRKCLAQTSRPQSTPWHSSFSPGRNIPEPIRTWRGGLAVSRNMDPMDPRTKSFELPSIQEASGLFQSSPIWKIKNIPWIPSR